MDMHEDSQTLRQSKIVNFYPSEAGLTSKWGRILPEVHQCCQIVSIFFHKLLSQSPGMLQLAIILLFWPNFVYFMADFGCLKQKWFTPLIQSKQLLNSKLATRQSPRNDVAVYRPYINHFKSAQLSWSTQLMQSSQLNQYEATYLE